jgi:hypothetical protein
MPLGSDLARNVNQPEGSAGSCTCDVCGQCSLAEGLLADRGLYCKAATPIARHQNQAYGRVRYDQHWRVTLRTGSGLADCQKRSQRLRDL